MKTPKVDLSKLRVGKTVLWLTDQNSVEVGTIVSAMDGDGWFDVCWLEGYKSRNDDVPSNRILAVADRDKGVQFDLGQFSGRGFLTEAGDEYVAAWGKVT